MSDATLQVLSSSGFVLAVCVGAVGVLFLVVYSSLAGRPATHGGVLLAACAGAMLATSGQMTALLALGLVVLALGGLVSASWLVSLVVVLPGAVIVGSSVLHSHGTPFAFLAVALIVVSSPLVAVFDRHHASTTIATPLVAISLIGVAFVVPDTEQAFIVAGTAAMWTLAGPPAMVTRLGRSGAYAVTGLFVWVAVSGGAARPESILAGAATLGILVAVPIVAAYRSGSDHKSDLEPQINVTFRSATIVVIQVTIGLMMMVIVRVGQGSIFITAALSMAVLATAGIMLTTRSSARVDAGR